MEFNKKYITYIAVTSANPEFKVINDMNRSAFLGNL